MSGLHNAKTCIKSVSDFKTCYRKGVFVTPQKTSKVVLGAIIVPQPHASYSDFLSQEETTRLGNDTYLESKLFISVALQPS